MPKLKQLGKPSSWYKKVICIAFVAISHWNIKNLKTRAIFRLKRIIFLPLIVIVEIAASLAKLWVSPLKKISVQIRKTSETNFLISWELVVTLLLSKKTRSKTIRICTRSNIMPMKKKSIILTSAQIKNQKTSIGLGNLYINDWS